MNYDANGNTTQKGVQQFTYDYRNQLLSAQDLNIDVNYKYDPFGRRVEKTTVGSSTTTKYFYDFNQVIEERNSSNHVTKQYVYGNGIDEILRVDKYESGNPVPYYYHTNAIGSVTAITDSSGQLVERISYDTFGMPTITDSSGTVISSSTIGNEYLFQGRRYDRAANLYYYRARYYDPIMGRFLQNDPMGYADSMNLYQGFGMNPVNFVDPFGLISAIPNRQPGPAPNFNVESGIKVIDYTVLNVLNSLFNLLGFTINTTTGALGFIDDKRWDFIDFTASKLKLIDRGEWRDDPQFRSLVDAWMIQNSMAKGTQYMFSYADEATQAAINLIRKKGGKILSVKGNVIVHTGGELSTDEMAEALGRGKTKWENNSAYQSIDDASGNVNYVGITNNVERRAAEHLRGRGIRIRPIQGLQKLSRSEAKAVEQVLIELHGLENHGVSLLNKINSIAKSNPKYADALMRGREILKELGYIDF